MPRLVDRILGLLTGREPQVVVLVATTRGAVAVRVPARSPRR